MTRLLPDLDPNAGIDRDELAILLDVDFADASATLLAEVGDGLDVMHRYDEDGDDEWRLADVEAIVERRRREGPRTFETARSHNKDRRQTESITFSDPGSTYSEVPSSQSSRAEDGIRLTEAARASGLSEDEMTSRLLGRAKIAIVKGDRIVRRGDLERLASEGVVPKPLAVERSRKVAAKIGSEDSSRDPAHERRLAEAGDRLGIGRSELGVEDAPRDAAHEAKVGAVADQLGIDRSEVRVPKKQTARDRRAAEVAEKLGIDYPS
ncbi:MAG: hypothetical protein R2725_05960 [Solirubrobacterales bacterium]